MWLLYEAESLSYLARDGRRQGGRGEKSGGKIEEEGDRERKGVETQSVY